ncbi:MAG TPA: hypothetical protein VJB65_00125, partial [Patescibacteria group bacterium]|nr:hypothetical protein [Patescibacteria group bacterium]
MQQCMQCKKAYEITKDDQKMYQQFQIPESMICHQCYLQTFFAFRNMRFFYKRHCDKCKREIISIYSADKPYPVYCNECFWKDDWSPFDYGREIDFSKPFFEQWNELALQVPHPHMISGDNENADYTCNSRGVKNCYMSSVVYNGSEDIYYSFWTFNCKNCCDIHYSYHSQLCYECYHIDDCYNCNFCIQSKNLTDCDYCSYCNNCTNCLFSVNLRNKKHHIFNKEYSPEEYEKKRAEIFANYETIQ